jgi:hypothetical protein
MCAGRDLGERDSHHMQKWGPRREAYRRCCWVSTAITGKTVGAGRAVRFESCVAPHQRQIWALGAEGFAGVRTDDEVERPAGEIPKHQAAQRRTKPSGKQG